MVQETKSNTSIQTDGFFQQLQQAAAKTTKKLKNQKVHIPILSQIRVYTMN